MTQLSWFPFDTEEWAHLVRDLSIEEEGALTRAVRTAWSAREAPATLADRPAAWDNLLGPRRRALEPVIRDFFVAHPDHPGRLHWPWLTSRYATQLERYESASRRGRMGGRPRKAEHEQESSAKSSGKSSGNSRATGRAISKAQAGQRQKLDGGVPPVLTDLGGTSPAPEALRAAPEGAQRPADRRTASPSEISGVLAGFGAVREALGVPPGVAKPLPSVLKDWAAQNPEIIELCEADVDAELERAGHDVLDPLVRKTRDRRVAAAIEEAYRRAAADAGQIALPITAAESGGPSAEVHRA